MIKHPLHYIGGTLFAAGAFTAGALSGLSGPPDPVRVLKCVRDGEVVFHEPVRLVPHIHRTGAQIRGEADEFVQVPGQCVTAICYPDDEREICGVLP